MPQDEQPFGGVPANLAALIHEVGFIPEEALQDDSNEAIEPARNGFCMTCGSELGNETVLLITKRGIGAAFCAGPCLQDQAVLGWLQEQHDDVVDNINFRGGRGDVAEG